MTMLIDFIWFCAVFGLMYSATYLCMGWWEREKEPDR